MTEIPLITNPAGTIKKVERIQVNQALTSTPISIESTMAYLTLIRPVNCLLAFISVLIGAWAGKGISITTSLITAGIIGFLISAFGNMINDLNDIDIDRINNPERPLITGKANKRTASVMSIISAGLGLLLSLALGMKPLILVLIVIVLLYLYAVNLKKKPVANFVIAFIAGLSFILGGIIVENPLSIFPFLFSIFIHFPREIVKDIIDIKGDRAARVRSLPIILNPLKAQGITIISLILLLMIIPIPFLLNLFSLTYILIAVIGTFPIIIFIIFHLRKEMAQAELKRISNLLKLSMAIGLVAISLS